MTVTPAYGRDYKSKADAIADWNGGKDFIIADISSPDDGRMCSCRDFPESQKIQLRYKKLTQVCIVNGAKPKA